MSDQHRSESNVARAALSSQLSASGGKGSQAKHVFFTQSRSIKKVGAALVFALLNGVSSPHVSRTDTFIGKQCTDKATGKFGFFINRFHTAATLYDGTLNELHALVFATVKGTNETYNFKQAMAESDREDFLAAMVKEIEDHSSREHWELMPRNGMPYGTKTIWSIWSFKRKRHPDGTLNKHKARLCAHGGMQVWGENYWETYAPVVNWLSVRLL